MRIFSKVLKTAFKLKHAYVRGSKVKATVFKNPNLTLGSHVLSLYQDIRLGLAGGCPGDHPPPNLRPLLVLTAAQLLSDGVCE